MNSCLESYTNQIDLLLSHFEDALLSLQTFVHAGIDQEWIFCVKLRLVSEENFEIYENFGKFRGNEKIPKNSRKTQKFQKKIHTSTNHMYSKVEKNKQENKKQSQIVFIN